MTDCAPDATSRPTALFFGENGCPQSTSGVETLKSLGFGVDAFLPERGYRGPLPEDVLRWRGDYLFHFRGYVILRKDLIERARIAAVNFHPAPPEYPGRGSINWALYDGAETYGATAHIMNEKVDNGPIVECRRFPILAEDTVDTLMARAHATTHRLMLDTFAGVAGEGVGYIDRKLAQSAGEKWSGRARRMREIDALQNIDPACSREELERIIRATYTDGFPPYVELHGYRFVLKR